MNKIAFTIISCLNFIFSYSQFNKNQAKSEITERMIDSMLENSRKSMGIDDNVTIEQFQKIYNYSESINYTEGSFKSGFMLMIYYFNMGDIRKSIYFGNEIEDKARKLDKKIYLGEIYTFRAMSLSKLNLLDESYKQFQNAIEETESSKNTDNEKHFYLSRIYSNMVSSYYEILEYPQDTILKYLKMSLSEAEQIDNSNKEIYLEEKYRSIAFCKMNLGMFYTGIYKPQRLDLGEKYLLEALALIKVKNATIGVDKNSEIKMLTSLGRLYIEKKDYEKAIIYSQKTLKLERKVKAVNSRKKAFLILKDAYEQLYNKDSINKYLSKYSSLTDSLNRVKTLSSHKELQKINYKQNIVHYNNLKLVLISSALFLIFTLLIIVFYWKKHNKKLHERYDKIIEDLKRKRREINIQGAIEEKKQEINIIIEKTITQKVSKNSAISDETTNNLLEKLNEFEKSEKYLMKDISLVYLANHFDTNTRYLSQIIKSHSGRSFNGYINQLRIKFIMEKLYKDPLFREYKISYLAEHCGYSSREVFFSAFKAEAGIPPSYFINQLKTDELPQD